jgi:hypothetical protein
MIYAESLCVGLERQIKEKQMGRPLRKDVIGTDVIGTGASTATGIRVDFYDSGLRTDGVIIKQRGAKTFVVARVGQIGTTSAYVTATVVTGEPAAYGEMRINGYIGGNGEDNLKSIAKITKRVATDFAGVKYNWYFENDSSADYIVLTAIV